MLVLNLGHFTCNERPVLHQSPQTTSVIGRKSMKITLKTALAGAVALGLTASAALAQEVTLRFQHFISPKGSVPAFFMQPWADKVEAASQGRIKIDQ